MARNITTAELNDLLDAQPGSSGQKKFVCPECGNEQCADDFMGKIEAHERRLYAVRKTCIRAYEGRQVCSVTPGRLNQCRLVDLIDNTGDKQAIMTPANLEL